jgi:hypothetical protein
VTCTAGAAGCPIFWGSLPVKRHQSESSSEIFMIAKTLILNRVEKSS